MEANPLVGAQYCCAALFCMFLLLYFAKNIRFVSHRGSTDIYLFLSVLLAAVCAGSDTVYGLREYGTLEIPDSVSYIFTIIYTVSCTLSGYYWLIYSEKKQQTWLAKNKVRFLIVTIPLFICVLLALTTPFTHLGFYFENGKYERGPLFMVMTFTSFVFIVWSSFGALFRSFKKRFYTQRKTLRLLFAYTISLLVIMEMQTNLPPIIPYRSLGLTALFLVMMVLMMKDQINVDALSRINNRFSLEKYLSEKMQGNEPFGVAFIDIDKFKSINDTYGHKVGDDAIRLTATAITSSVPKNYFVSRYGGDEFVIVGDCNVARFQKLETAINATLSSKLKNAGYSFDMTVSLGFTVKDNSIDNIPDLLNKADNELYKQKASKR